MRVPRRAGIVHHLVNEATLDRTFAACAHPIRRGIIERLAVQELTVGEATRDFQVSKPAITKHLRVLEDAGAIERVVVGRSHRLRLSRDALEDARSWIDGQRALWERKFEVIDEYLAERRDQGGGGDS
jgi:DNA-binding transcriptional ArsR family regulator